MKINKLKNDFIAHLKQTLQPQGTAPVIRLFLNKATYLPKKNIENAISEINKLFGWE